LRLNGETANAQRNCLADTTVSLVQSFRSTIDMLLNVGVQARPAVESHCNEFPSFRVTDIRIRLCLFEQLQYVAIVKPTWAISQSSMSDHLNLFGELWRSFRLFKKKTQSKQIKRRQI
jgi:hypothetical protein